MAEELEGGSSEPSEDGGKETHQEEIKQMMDIRTRSDRKSNSIVREDTSELSYVEEYDLSLTDCVPYTAAEEKIAFVVSLWDAKDSLKKTKQLLIKSTQVCSPMLSGDGTTLALQLDNVVQFYDSVSLEKIAEIDISRNMSNFILSNC